VLWKYPPEDRITVRYQGALAETRLAPPAVHRRDMQVVAGETECLPVMGLGTTVVSR